LASSARVREKLLSTSADRPFRLKSKARVVRGVREVLSTMKRFERTVPGHDAASLKT